MGIGGGSVIDTAKSVALLMTNPGSIINYEGFNRYSKHPLPMIAIPTTAGSGSEVTRGLIISDTRRNFKMTVAGNELAPRYAVLDPYMVASLPPILGYDRDRSVDPCYRGFCSLEASPLRMPWPLSDRDGSPAPSTFCGRPLESPGGHGNANGLRQWRVSPSLMPHLGNSMPCLHPLGGHVSPSAMDWPMRSSSLT